MAAANLLSPGQSVTQVRKGPTNIEASPAVSRACFQGVAKKGPPRIPILTKSFADFLAVFGSYVTGGYLAEEVEAFFKQVEGVGGECYVCRAAHYTDVQDPLSYDMAAAAVTLQDAAPANTVVVAASSPGVWGGVSTAPGYKVTTLRRSALVTTLAVALLAGANAQATLVNASRLQIGDMLTLADATNSNTVEITSLNGNVIYFGSVNVAVGGIATVGSSATLLTFDMSAIDENGSTVRTWSDLRMSPLSFRYFLNIVNNDFRTPFTLTDSASATADSRPANATGTPLVGGSDGLAPTTTGGGGGGDYEGSSVGKTGLYAMDTKADFGLLAIPGITATGVTQALITYAAARELFIALVEPPQGSSPSQVVTYVNTTINRFSSFAAISYSWVKIVDPLTGARLSAPPSGFHAGVLVRTDRTRGVWKPAAGEIDGQLRGAVDLDYSVQTADYDTLYPNRINAFQSFEGKGIFHSGNVTLDPTTEYQELHLQRFILMLKTSIKNGTSWVNFELNNKATRARVTRNLRTFLKGFWKPDGTGALQGDKLDDAMFVACNETNNDAISIAQRKLNIRIGVAVVHATEFVYITIEQDTRAIDAALASSA